MRPINTPFGLVVHAGSETIVKNSLTPAREQSLRDALTDVLLVGHRILAGGGTSLDAVEAPIRILEDCHFLMPAPAPALHRKEPSSLTLPFMNGWRLTAGAVAGLRHIRNPISLGRLVMEESPHVMLVGDGAEAFAREKRIEMVSR